MCVGKHIVLTIEADSMQEADALAKEACEKLLVNPYNGTLFL